MSGRWSDRKLVAVTVAIVVAIDEVEERLFVALPNAALRIALCSLALESFAISSTDAETEEK